MRTLPVALAAAAVALTGCAQFEPAPVTAKVAVTDVRYDCVARALTVRGQVDPARPGQRVQVRVRSAEKPRAPVWRIVSADRNGVFVAAGTYPIDSKELTMEVRAASVVRGARVFSSRTLEVLRCPAGPSGP